MLLSKFKYCSFVRFYRLPNRKPKITSCQIRRKPKIFTSMWEKIAEIYHNILIFLSCNNRVMEYPPPFPPAKSLLHFAKILSYHALISLKIMTNAATPFPLWWKYSFPNSKMLNVTWYRMFEQREDNASINQYCPDTQILIPSIADPGS